MIFPYKLIDLTHTLHSGIPTWNGGCGFQHNVHIDYGDCEGEDKFRVMKVNMHAGIGTHMDAPSHCIEGGMCLHEFDVNQLCMPCVVIDITAKSHEAYSLSANDIANFERQHGPIMKGACVMVKTGWSKFWHRPSSYHNNHMFPSVSLEAAQLLLKREVGSLGIDTLSPDRPSDGFGVHQSFLSANKPLLENVANLENMPPTGAFVMALPIKIQDGTEAPVRLVGLIHRA
jgi:kynurenine formamidase